MARRITYSDAFSGEADRDLKALLDDSDDNSELRGRMKKVLLNVIKNELTARQKEILMLYYFKETDTVKIAAQLGVTPQAVSAVLKRARLRIYRYMQYYVK